ncbi:MAG: site-2 protease family protein [Lachnospiraceae bacterium]|nr:site-2 protease family protein [Lachnospiraceae bacterium]
MSIILIILIFGIIVFFHEFGHFLFAKLNHIAVNEFSIGMGPAIVSFKKKETKYSLRIFPIGGYCMMEGEDEESDSENAFSNKPVWVRMLVVVVAGPLFNFILAFIFAIILVHFTGCDPATLYYVAPDSAAEEAGIAEGDTILEINGDKIYNYRELLLYMQLNDASKPVELTMVTPDGDEYVTVVSPKLDKNGEYKLGVIGGYVESEGIGTDLKYGALELRYWFKATITSLKMIFTGGVSSDDIMGPVGVGGAFDDVLDEVKEASTTKKEEVINIILNMLNWCILLSVNLGVMNLLPIPALDGGRLLFLIIEAVRRKKIPQDKEAFVNFIGFVLLIILMIVVFFNDIKNVFF